MTGLILKQMTGKWEMSPRSIDEMLKVQARGENDEKDSFMIIR